jgi:hypothetical protein
MGEKVFVIVAHEGDLVGQRALQEQGYEPVTVVVSDDQSIWSKHEDKVFVPNPACDAALQHVLAWALERFPNADFYEYGGKPLGSPSITVKVQQVGFHHWGDAPEEVAYLRDSHRHVFHASFTIRDLNHADRDQEFHLVQGWVREEFAKILDHAKREGMSCEMMAQRLCIRGRVKYQSSISCEVSEDGENHATVTI